MIWSCCLNSATCLEPLPGKATSKGSKGKGKGGGKSWHDDRGDDSWRDDWREESGDPQGRKGMDLEFETLMDQWFFGCKEI